MATKANVGRKKINQTNDITEGRRAPMKTKTNLKAGSLIHGN
jgi:hypothetical protein